MLHPLVRTLVKVAVASLIVGSVLAHFGITADMLLRESGMSLERVEELARRGVAWALPNLLLGSMIILPVWFVIYRSVLPAAAATNRLARADSARPRSAHG
jgi:hypothetical protein